MAKMVNDWKAIEKKKNPRRMIKVVVSKEEWERLTDSSQYPNNSLRNRLRKAGMVVFKDARDYQDRWAMAESIIDRWSRSEAAREAHQKVSPEIKRLEEEITWKHHQINLLRALAEAEIDALADKELDEAGVTQFRSKRGARSLILVEEKANG